MALWRPTRREIITTAPLALGVAAAIPASAQIMPRSATLRFFVIGDWGRDGGHYQKHVANWMAEKARHLGCDFIVSTGDNFYTFGVSRVDDPQWKTSYEDIYADELRSIPWFPVAGNHDWGGNVWAQLDRSGNGGWHMPWLWYDIPGRLFHRSDVHLFFVDTVVWQEKEGHFKYCGQAIRERDIADQRNWLVQALSASCASTKLVFGHHPIYTVGRHARSENEKAALMSLNQILIDNNVSAYISGHDHSLYHIRSTKPDGTPVMDYICSGGGSEELPEYHGGLRSGCVIRGQCEQRKDPTWYSFLGSAGFAIFDVGPYGLSFQFMDRNGNGTEKTAIPIRGLFKENCQGIPPIDQAVLKERAHARAKTWIPCTKLPQGLVDLVS